LLDVSVRRGNPGTVFWEFLWFSHFSVFVLAPWFHCSFLLFSFFLFTGYGFSTTEEGEQEEEDEKREEDWNRGMHGTH
jgi:hypothetical protein